MRNCKIQKFLFSFYKTLRTQIQHVKSGILLTEKVLRACLNPSQIRSEELTEVRWEVSGTRENLKPHFLTSVTYNKGSTISMSFLYKEADSKCRHTR